MTLPDVCPKDGISQCKKKACHLYVVEWRTGDEQCVIGYRATHKQLSKSMPLEDTYAQSTRIRLGREGPHERDVRHGSDHIYETVSYAPERKHLQRSESNVETDTATSEESPRPVRYEEVVVNNKDTTVFESKHIEETKSKDNRKRTSLDKMMDLDLPENYEEEFWK
ncbi:hypothetical protein [Methanolobus psychrotolerans]|uniref:hypothetical protein n=1 Tax=Methanolobus psychrotolerans TaxID=1874706 RepID=UPI000B91CA46|nr:hypothetical protein [Methanolobus psychrotolerans]